MILEGDFYTVVESGTEPDNIRAVLKINRRTCHF